MSRVKQIGQKRAALKGKITKLTEAVSKNKIDKTNLMLQLDALKKSFLAYEDLHDELAILDPENEGLEQMDEIHDRFYEIATRISNLQTPGGSTANMTITDIPMGSSTFIERQKLLKLPTADLPKFGGEYGKWLSFKNVFKTMVDDRTDINDLVKFYYLKNSLYGEALNKIAVYDIKAENYKTAWNLLHSSYDRKRILVTKHFDALIDAPRVVNATPQNLTKLIDDARQHLAQLDSLEVKVPDPLAVRLLERTLPIETRKEWEKTLTLDKLSTMDEFCKFIDTATFQLSNIDLEETRIQAGKTSKRPADKSNPGVSKKMKVDVNTRALATTTTTLECPHCKGPHALYRCDAYYLLDTNAKWSIVKTQQLCSNCLRKHSGNCTSGNCRKCSKPHHTSLHQEDSDAKAAKPSS